MLPEDGDDELPVDGDVELSACDIVELPEDGEVDELPEDGELEEGELELEPPDCAIVVSPEDGDDELPEDGDVELSDCDMVEPPLAPVELPEDGDVAELPLDAAMIPVLNAKPAASIPMLNFFITLLLSSEYLSDAAHL